MLSHNLRLEQTQQTNTQQQQCSMHCQSRIFTFSSWILASSWGQYSGCSHSSTQFKEMSFLKQCTGQNLGYFIYTLVKVLIVFTCLKTHGWGQYQHQISRIFLTHMAKFWQCITFLYLGFCKGRIYDKRPCSTLSTIFCHPCSHVESLW